MHFYVIIQCYCLIPNSVGIDSRGCTSCLGFVALIAANITLLKLVFSLKVIQHKHAS